MKEDEKSTDTEDEKEEELELCGTNHGDWKNYKEETLPSWCAPNSFYGGKKCANCEKEFVQKIEEDKKGKSYGKTFVVLIYVFKLLSHILHFFQFGG